MKPEDRADPKSVYHMMTVDEVQELFGSVVCTLEVERLTLLKLEMCLACV